MSLMEVSFENVLKRAAAVTVTQSTDHTREQVGYDGLGVGSHGQGKVACISSFNNHNKKLMHLDIG